jgi:hypothetical protein
MTSCEKKCGLSPQFFSCSSDIRYKNSQSYPDNAAMLHKNPYSFRAMLIRLYGCKKLTIYNRLIFNNIHRKVNFFPKKFCQLA